MQMYFTKCNLKKIVRLYPGFKWENELIIKFSIITGSISIGNFLKEIINATINNTLLKF